MTPCSGQRRTWLFFCSLGLLNVAGCATPYPKAADIGAFWTGRIALQLQTTPPQNWTATFQLNGSAEQGQMTLFSPIGTTMARLSWTPQIAMLEQGQEQTISSNLQSLSQQLTGTDLPITDLFKWLEGRAGDASGWQVDLSQHPQGRLSAKRVSPAPEAVLRILLEQ